MSHSVTAFSGHESRALVQVRTLAPIPAASRVTDLRNHSNAASRQPADSVLYANIPYTSLGGRLERLDIYVPTGPAPAGGWPVILAIHGGGWRRFNKNEYGPRIASAFVSHGYEVVAPNYRLSAPGNPSWPLNLEELQSAVRWVRSHASQFSINTDHVVAMGESAGANLANLLGSQSSGGATAAAVDSASVEAVVSFSSPTDLDSLYAESSRAGKAVAQFLGGPPAAVPDNYAAASPVNQVSPNSAPTLLIHGESDPLVPVSQSMELARALTGAGVHNDLVILPGSGHDLNFPVATPRNLITEILEFLAATWKDGKSQSQTINTH